MADVITIAQNSRIAANLGPGAPLAGCAMMAVMATRDSRSGTKPKGKPRGRPFPPGVSGNEGGRPVDGLSLASLLRIELEKDGGGGKTKGELIAAKWVELGLAGSPVAISAMADRIDGKAAQSVTFTGDANAPLHVRHSPRLEVEPKVPSPNGSPAPTASG